MTWTAGQREFTPLLLGLYDSSTSQKHLKNGTGALAPADVRLIAKAERSKIGDSLDLDAATKDEFPERSSNFAPSWLCWSSGFADEQEPPGWGEHGFAPCSPTLRRNTPPAGGLLKTRADGWPFLLCPLDSVFKERHSALPGLRPAWNGLRASCPGPFRFGFGSAGLAESCFAPESIRSNHQKLLTVRNRSRHDGMALARPSEASDAPESRWSRRPGLLRLRNASGQAVMHF